MLRTRPQNGITLIALIITVIVMLILVGVTISVVLNGGLFTQAQEASKNTQIEADREQLLSAVVGAIGTDAKVDFSKLDSNLPYGWTKVTDKTYRSPKGNVFTVDENGTIKYKDNNKADEGTDSATLELIKTYFAGQVDETTGERPGINLTTEETIIAEPSLSEIFNAKPSDIKFKNNEIISDAYEKMSVTSFGDEEGVGYYLYVSYNGIVYKVTAGLDYVTNDNVEVILEKTETIGKYVQYDDKLWIILYDEGEYGEGAQLISANALGSVTLGNLDSNIDWENSEVIKEANKFEVDNPSEEEVLSYVEKAIYSYNHAIETLNSECASLVIDKSKVATDSNGKYLIRSVGTNPNNPSDTTNTYCEAEELSAWPEEKYNSIYPTGSFSGVGKNADNNYLIDFTRMESLGIVMSDNSERYYLASRSIEIYADQVYFKIYYTLSFYLRERALFYVHESSFQPEYKSECVRPVITLASGVLSNAVESSTDADGSAKNPYQI